MPATDFNHGARVIQVGQTPRPVALANMRPIGAILVAPEADNTKFPLNEPVSFFSNDTTMKTAAGNGGNVDDVFDAIEDQGVVTEVVAVRVAQGAGSTPADILNNTITNIVGSGANLTGVHAFKGAESHVGVRPRLFIAPGYTDMRVGAAANPVVTEMAGIATRLKGMVIADADATSKTAAYAWRQDFGANKRIYAVTPAARVFEGGAYVTRPLAGRVAALFNRKWKERGGPYFSPSNQTIGGIGGVSRPISYYPGELDHEANWLNMRGLATVIENNLLWGNRTLGYDQEAGTGDPNDMFVNVVITLDAIDESIVRAFRWAMDQNFSAHLGVAIVEQVDAFLGELYQIGATIARGRCWFDRAVNSWADLQMGKLRFEFSREPAPPLEDLIFAAHRDPGAFEVLAADIIARLNQRVA